MLHLNLLNPDKSDIPFKFLTFPDGQPHLKIDTSKHENTEGVTILSRISNPSDLFTVLIAKDALESAGFEHVELTVTYLMAARMDRQMNEGEPFSLRVLARVLNQANFKQISIKFSTSAPSRVSLIFQLTLNFSNITINYFLLQRYSRIRFYQLKGR